MDYEKKYKEALERAKKFEEKYGGGYAGFIFPELKESEDERIRKAIIGLIEELQRSEKYFAGVELTDMLAWLEKQKEQEHICDSAQYEEGFKTGYELGLRKQKRAEAYPTRRF